MIFPVVLYGYKSWTIKKEFILSNFGTREDSWGSNRTHRTKQKDTLPGGSHGIFLGKSGMYQSPVLKLSFSILLHPWKNLSQHWSPAKSPPTKEVTTGLPWENSSSFQVLATALLPRWLPLVCTGKKAWPMSTPAPTPAQNDKWLIKEENITFINIYAPYREHLTRANINRHKGEINSNTAIFVVVLLSLSCVQFFVAPWTAAHQASLSFTIPQSLLKLMFIELVLPSNHLDLCCPLLFCL